MANTRFGMGEYLKKDEKNDSLYDIHQSVPEETGMSTQDKLAIAGMVGQGPLEAVGLTADLASAGLYAKEGDFKNTLWSLLSAVPVIGGFANVKRGKKAVKALAKTLTKTAKKGKKVKIDKPWMKKPIMGEKSFYHKFRGYGPTADGKDVGVLNKLSRRHDLSSESYDKLKKLKLKYNNYMTQDWKMVDGKAVGKSRGARVSRQGGNELHESIKKADYEIFKEISEGAAEIVKKEGNPILQLEFDNWIGTTTQAKWRPPELTKEELDLIKETRAEKKLFREGQSGYTDKGVKIK